MRPFRLFASVLTSAALFGASPNLGAQEAGEVLSGIRNGGGWISIPIQGGVAEVSTGRLPSAGMTLVGCLNVWHGHSGEWQIRAHDTVSDSTVVVRATPGVGVPFSHTFGLSAQVDFDFRWSEPRDTTLLVWVGLAIGKTKEEACEPTYGDGSPRR
jgi:hypothetical protein